MCSVYINNSIYTACSVIITCQKSETVNREMDRIRKTDLTEAKLSSMGSSLLRNKK